MVLALVGIHNIDVAYNWYKAGYVADSTLSGTLNLDEIHKQGIRMIFVSSMLILFSIVFALTLKYAKFKNKS